MKLKKKQIKAIDNLQVHVDCYQYVDPITEAELERITLIGSSEDLQQLLKILIKIKRKNKND